MDRFVVIAHVVEPVDDVFAAIAPRGARGAPDAEVDTAAFKVQVLRDLATRLT